MAEKVAPKRPKLHLKVGDTVYVRAGADREARLSPEDVERFNPQQQKTEANKRPGRRGRVIKVLPNKMRVVVEGVNMLIRHTRPKGRVSQTQQLQTGRIEQPGSVSVANVMLVCPRCDRPARVRKGMVEGKTVRLCRRCGEPIDAIK